MASKANPRHRQSWNGSRQEQQRRAAETLKGYDRAARRAVAIWQAAKPAPVDHPYLITKQIKPHGARLGSWQRTIQDEAGKHQKLIIENSLILPMYNADGKIRSLQAIFPEKHPLLGRNKDFLPGGQVAGLFWWIGPKTDKVLICEGFATAATLHEETANRVYMAFTANNRLSATRPSPTAASACCPRILTAKPWRAPLAAVGRTGRGSEHAPVTQ